MRDDKASSSGVSHRARREVATMKSIQALSLTIVLVAGPVSGFAAVGSEQAREANAVNETRATEQTTARNSSTMSAPNVPSHDGNSQLGSTGTSHAQTAP